MKGFFLSGSLLASIFLCGGCFCTSRYTASIRPAVVKVASCVTNQYRIARVCLISHSQSVAAQQIVAKKNEKAKIEKSIRDKGGNPEDPKFSQMRKYYDNQIALAEEGLAGANATIAEDNEIVLKTVQDSCKRNYPSLFADSPQAIPLTLVIRHGFQCHTDGCNLLFAIFIPVSAFSETRYYVYVKEDSVDAREDELAKEMAKAQRGYPPSPNTSGGIRRCDGWGTILLPFGWIPNVGEKDFPRGFSWCGLGHSFATDTPSDQETYNSPMGFRKMVFDPKVDGDVLAATVVRVLNKKARVAELNLLTQEN